MLFPVARLYFGVSLHDQRRTFFLQRDLLPSTTPERGRLKCSLSLPRGGGVRHSLNPSEKTLCSRASDAAAPLAVVPLVYAWRAAWISPAFFSNRENHETMLHLARARKKTATPRGRPPFISFPGLKTIDEKKRTDNKPARHRDKFSCTCLSRPAAAPSAKAGSENSGLVSGCSCEFSGCGVFKNLKSFFFLRK